MKNKNLLTMLSLVALTALSGCKPKEPSSSNTDSGSNNGTDSSGSNTTPVERSTKIDFWTGFGKSVNSVLEPLIKRFEDQNPTIKVSYSTKEGYPNLMQAINSSISNNAFPHIANGYPDHFAGYANSGVLMNLNTATYINNPDTGVDIDLYLPSYMAENKELVPGAISGLPFNKSTEVMVTNQTFFDVAKKLDPTVKVPETWQELRVQGLKLKKIIKDHKWVGKLIAHDGTTIEKPEKPTPEQIEALIPQVAFDMTMVKSESEFVPFSWDSGANFFITILRQWGAKYTEPAATFQKGYLAFNNAENMPTTRIVLKYFQDLYKDGIVGLPSTYGETLYSSKPFKEGKLVLTVSSSAGVTNNIPVGLTDFPFEVSINKIPYNGDKPDNRFVISQGTNLALFKRGQANDPKVKLEREAAWRLLRYLTYEVNHEFGMGTSYYPVTDGTLLPEDETDQRYLDYKLYKEFLTKEQPDKTEAAIRDAARVQADGYQEKGANDKQIWTQFVDPGFVGSAIIRLEVENIMGKIFADNLSPDLAVKDIVDKLKEFVKN